RAAHRRPGGGRAGPDPGGDRRRRASRPAVPRAVPVGPPAMEVAAGLVSDPAFSLLFFASRPAPADRDKFDLFRRSTRFADERGFQAVWIPERHFHAFGGIFPNPSLAGAVLAGTTRRIRIRAGSVVMPLHHPIRVAEEWAVVDNLSGGRVDVSF